MANACHHLVDLELHAPTSVRSPARLQELALGCLVAPQKGIEQDMTGPYWCSFQLLWRKLQCPTTTLDIAPKNSAKVCRSTAQQYQRSIKRPMHTNAPIISHLLRPIAAEALVWIAALTMASANLSLPYIRRTSETSWASETNPRWLSNRLHLACGMREFENLFGTSGWPYAFLGTFMVWHEQIWGNTVTYEGNDAPPPPASGCLSSEDANSSASPWTCLRVAKHHQITLHKGSNPTRANDRNFLRWQGFWLLNDVRFGQCLN